MISQRVWQIVAAIPEGDVTTYGDVAKLAGSPGAARQVGGVLKRLPEGSTLPWHGGQSPRHNFVHPGTGFTASVTGITGQKV